MSRAVRAGSTAESLVEDREKSTASTDDARDATGELDALIDETVFGYAWQPVTPEDIAPPTCTHRLCAPSYTEGKSFHIRAERHADGRVVVFDGRHYATDPADALLALAQVGGIVTIHRIRPGEWHVRIDQEKWWAETLPLAICHCLLAISTPKVAA